MNFFEKIISEIYNYINNPPFMDDLFPKEDSDEDFI